MERLLQHMRDARELARKAGPYLLVEIVLPGGTLIALAMFLIQRAHGGTPEGGLGAIALVGSALRRARAFARWFAREWVAVVGAAGLQAPRARDGLEPLGFDPG